MGVAERCLRSLTGLALSKTGVAGPSLAYGRYGLQAIPLAETVLWGR
jgi:hypothetical protein